MSDITGGELLARALQAEGIEYLFGLPSPESDPLLAVLVDHGFLRGPGSPRGRCGTHGGGALQDDRQGGGGAR